MAEDFEDARLSPLQIRKQSFRQSTFGGYRKEDVTEYLSSIADNWQTVHHKNQELKRQVEYLQNELAKLKEIERTLLESLSQAQEANRLTWEQAQKRADLTILEGKMQADALLQQAKAQSKAILLGTQNLIDQTLSEMKREIKLLNYAYEYSAQQKNHMLAELQAFMKNALQKIEQLAQLDVERSSENALIKAEKMHQYHSQLIRKQLKKIENPGDEPPVPTYAYQEEELQDDKSPTILPSNTSTPQKEPTNQPTSSSFAEKKPTASVQQTYKPSSRGVIFDLNNL